LAAVVARRGITARDAERAEVTQRLARLRTIHYSRFKIYASESKPSLKLDNPSCQTFLRATKVIGVVDMRWSTTKIKRLKV
jgi:hypothetical protein